MKTSKVLVAALLLLFAAQSLAQERFSEWGEAQPVRTSGTLKINTSTGEGHAVISRDGLTLFFLATRLRQPNYGGRDIWYATRPSQLADWENPRNAGCAVNSEWLEEGAMLTPDNHHLFFASNRPADGFGGFDLYVSRRRPKNQEPVCSDAKSDDQGWLFPQNLGPGINTADNETSPAFFQDEQTGEVYLYFVRDSAGAPNSYDLYVSRMEEDGTFLSAESLSVMNSTCNEDGPFVSKTGLELYFNSGRTGGPCGSGDLFVSKRASTSDPWPAPVNVNAYCEFKVSDPLKCPSTPAANEVGPVLSWDGTELYFAAAFRFPGNVTNDYDMWIARRTRLTGKPSE